MIDINSFTLMDYFLGWWSIGFISCGYITYLGLNGKYFDKETQAIFTKVVRGSRFGYFGILIIFPIVGAIFGLYGPIMIVSYFITRNQYKKGTQW